LGPVFDAIVGLVPEELGTMETGTQADRPKHAFTKKHKIARMPSSE